MGLRKWVGNGDFNNSNRKSHRKKLETIRPLEVDKCAERKKQTVGEHKEGIRWCEISDVSTRPFQEKRLVFIGQARRNWNMLKWDEKQRNCTEWSI